MTLNKKNYLVKLILISGLILFLGCNTDDKEPISNNDITKPIIVSITPTDGSTDVGVDSTITVTFSEPMDATTVQGNYSDTQCTGNIQLSSDDFTTCIQFASGSASDENKSYIFTSLKNLSGSTIYKIKISVNVKDIASNSISEEFTSSFTTVSTSIMFAVGYYTDSLGNRLAAIWKNSVKTDLPVPDGTTSSYAYSLYVLENDEYVAGYYMKSSGDKIACYWRNGIRTDLTDGTNSSFAYSIFISGVDIYIAGYYFNDSNKQIACYWKNGTKTDLTNGTNGTNGAYAYDIFVSNNIIYVGGYYTQISPPGNVACFWKDGVKNDLTDGSSGALVNSIYVSGSDVYNSGYTTNAPNMVATYWKNNIKIELTSGSNTHDSTDIFVSGTDIYIAGIITNASGNTVATYWKNSSKVELSDGTSNASALSIHISENDIYIGGYYTNSSNKTVGCYWKNGTKTDLTDGTDNGEIWDLYYKK